MKKKKFNLNFRLVLISKTISVVGGNILGFAMILFLVDFTQSAALLGTIMAITQIPSVVIMPFAGMIADRLDKKKLIVLFDVVTALSDFLLLWLLLTGSYTIINIVFLRMIRISIVKFAATVFTAAVPRIVEEDQLIGANGVLQSIGAVGLIGGSVIGGILFGVLGIQMIAFASGVLFLISAGISMAIKIPHVKMKVVGGMILTIKSDMRDSFHFLTNEKPMIFRLFLVTSIITFLFLPLFMVGLPFIVDVTFNRQVTVSFAIAAIGMFVGGICAGSLKKHLAIKHLAKWIGLMGASGLFLALAVSLALSSLSVAFWLFNMTLALTAFVFSLINSSFGAFIQQEVSKHLLGKVNALYGRICLFLLTGLF